MKKLMFLFLSIFLMLTISNASAYTMPTKEYLSNSLSGSTTTAYKSACGTGSSLLFTGSINGVANTDGTASVNTVYSSKITNCANAIARKIVSLNEEAVNFNKAYYNSKLDMFLSGSLNARKNLFITRIEANPTLSGSFSGNYENYKFKFKTIFTGTGELKKFNMASSGAMNNLKSAINDFTNMKFSLVNSGSMADATKLGTNESTITGALEPLKTNVLNKIDALFTISGSYFITTNDKFAAYKDEMRYILNANLDSEIDEVKALVAYKNKAYDIRNKINNNGKIALATELSKLTFNDESFNGKGDIKGFKNILKESITGIKRLDTPLLEQNFTPAFFQEVINEASARKGSISSFVDNIITVTNQERGFIVYLNNVGELGYVITLLRNSTEIFTPAVKGTVAHPTSEQ